MENTKGVAMKFEIVHTNSAQEARRLCGLGYEPVECSFGSEGSVLGPLEMDHHGEDSHREGVALRAYRDHYGARDADPRFVVTGAADADATFAIASLAGLLPHPSRVAEFASSPPWLAEAMTKDLNDLAALVNQVDTDPFLVELEREPLGPLLLLWNTLSSGVEDAQAFYGGVDRWRALTGPRALKPLLAAVKDSEMERVAKAEAADLLLDLGLVAALASESWGFDVWYRDWPCVVAYVTATGAITVGCRDVVTAARMFGPGGLKNAFSQLGSGWGGRETVGGSPRGERMTQEDAIRAAKILHSLLKSKGLA